jgi:large subunit ribosomal protein L28
LAHDLASRQTAHPSSFEINQLLYFGERIMAKCEICGRGPQFGNHVSFSQRHVKRRFNANVQKRKVLINGQMRRVHICTSCLKTLSKTSA